MNNKYFICYYLHTVLLKKMLIIHKFLWNQVKQLLKKIYITKPFTVYFRKLGLGLVLLWFVDDLLRGSNLQISCTHEFLAPFLKEMDFIIISSRIRIHNENFSILPPLNVTNCSKFSSFSIWCYWCYLQVENSTFYIKIGVANFWAGMFEKSNILFRKSKDDH